MLHEILLSFRGNYTERSCRHSGWKSGWTSNLSHLVQPRTETENDVQWQSREIEEEISLRFRDCRWQALLKEPSTSEGKQWTQSYCRESWFQRNNKTGHSPMSRHLRTVTLIGIWGDENIQSGLLNRQLIVIQDTLCSTEYTIRILHL